MADLYERLPPAQAVAKFAAIYRGQLIATAGFLDGALRACLESPRRGGVPESLGVVYLDVKRVARPPVLRRTCVGKMVPDDLP